MKTVRQLAIADHLWDLLDRMARDMGVEREALVNQALHLLARQAGYLPAAPAAAPPELETTERSAAAEEVLATAARLEQAMKERAGEDRPPALPAALGGEQEARTLLLVREDGSEAEVARDRFVIGRGRRCDLVIASQRISREHAVIVREGADWFIEDLGSANGTWHGHARVQRRRIEDGDEYYLCAERVRCVLR